MLCFLIHVTDPVTAFHVYRPYNTPSKRMYTVTFVRYSLNQGIGYNHNTGKFTAKHDGIYYFAAQLRNEYFINAKISVYLYHYHATRRQTNIKATTIGYSQIGTQIGAWYTRQLGGSLQAVVQLKAHHQVWVGIVANDKVKLNHHSYFNGFLLA